jgi:hypothetical protein
MNRLKPTVFLLQTGVANLKSLDLIHSDAEDYDLICLPMGLACIEGAPAKAVF